MQEIFEDEEVRAYLDSYTVVVNNSLYDHVIYDRATIEKTFALALDRDPDVKMYFVTETKGSLDHDDIRGREDMKIIADGNILKLLEMKLGSASERLGKFKILFS